MILYRDDIFKQGAHIHLETKNRSFIKLSKIYQKMEIENRYFFLALHDRDLIHIDPHNLPEGLSNDELIKLKAKIIHESYRNPWYFFREVVKSPGDGPIFQANRANIPTLWLMLQCISLISIMARQHGKTVTQLAFELYLMHCRGRSHKSMMLCNGDKLRTENMQKFNEMVDSLPNWFVMKSKEDANNANTLSNYTFNNHLKTQINAHSEQNAGKLGRGFTVERIWSDETAFTKYVQLTLDSARPALDRAKRDAETTGKLYGQAYTTTPGSLSNRDGKYVYDRFIRHSYRFNESLFDCKDIDEVNSIIRKGSTISMVLVEFNPFQLGASDDWVTEVAKQAIPDGDYGIKRFMIEYFNVWSAESSNSIVPPKQVDKIQTSEKEPDWLEYIDDYTIYWYRPEYVTRSKEFLSLPLVIGTDGSEAIGKDYTTFVILDATNMEVIGRMRVNESNIIQLATSMANVLMKYPNSVYIPEVNHTGRAIIDTMLNIFKANNINPFKKIYNTYVENLREDDVDTRSLLESSDCHHVADKNRDKFGYRTGSTSRDALFKTTLNKAINHNADKFNDRALIEEVLKLSIRKGRIDHDPNGHDDLVVAYLLACYFLYYSKQHRFYWSNYKNLSKKPLCDYSESIKKGIDEHDILRMRYNSLLSELSDSEIKFRAMGKYTAGKEQLYQHIRYLRAQIPDELLVNNNTNDSMSDVVESNKESITFDNVTLDKSKQINKASILKAYGV